MLHLSEIKKKECQQCAMHFKCLNCSGYIFILTKIIEQRKLRKNETSTSLTCYSIMYQKDTNIIICATRIYPRKLFLIVYFEYFRFIMWHSIVHSLIAIYLACDTKCRTNFLMKERYYNKWGVFLKVLRKWI